MNVELSITEQCNLRCSYCYYRETHGKRCAVMSDEVMEAAVRLAVKKSIEIQDTFLNITFFGGEPLLRMDFIKKTVEFTKKLIVANISKLRKDYGILFAVNTNGTLLTDDIIDYLKREHFIVCLSLDGPEKKHNISRVYSDGKGSFAAIKPFLPTLIEMNAETLSVVTPRHVKGLADSVKWLFKQGFKSVSVTQDFDGTWTGEDFDNLIVEYEKLARFWYQSKKRGDDLYLSVIQDKITMEARKVRQRNLTCFINSKAIVVAANGNLFPCTRFISSKKNAPYVLGNILDKQSGFYKGVIPPKISRFVNNDKKECDGCAIRYRCVAHECGCTSFYTTGTLEKISPEVCTHERILCTICDEYAVKLQRATSPERIL